MDTEHCGDSEESELLMSQDRAKGFSVQMNESRNITLLKRDKPVAWFSAAISAETVRAMVRLIASYEKASQTGNKRGTIA